MYQDILNKIEYEFTKHIPFYIARYRTDNIQCVFETSVCKLINCIRRSSEISNQLEHKYKIRKELKKRNCLRKVKKTKNVNH